MPATLLLLISLAISFLSLLGMVTFRWRDYILPYIVFKKQQKAQTAASTNSDGISIIITSYNQAHHLEKNIPILFQQDYPKFEIIIVDESSLDDTKAVIQKLETEYECLRHTFVPQTSRFISKRKLAITLGIKAAHYPWVVLLEADCTPKDKAWLQTVSQQFSEDKDFILGYTNYIDDKPAHARRAIFERMKLQFHYLSFAKRRKAFGADSCNLFIRKKYFIEHKGYADTFQVPLGEGSLLISYLAQKHNTTICVNPQATILQMLPSVKTFKSNKILREEEARHWNIHGKLFILKEAISNIITLLFIANIVWFLYLRISAIAENRITYSLPELYYDAPCLCFVILYIALPIVFLRKSTSALSEKGFGLSVTLYELMQPCKDVLYKLRWWFRRKDFKRR